MNAVEWREIPSFPNYEVNVVGYVRERSTRIVNYLYRPTSYWLIDVNGNGYEVSKEEIMAESYPKDVENVENVVSLNAEVSDEEELVELIYNTRPSEVYSYREFAEMLASTITRAGFRNPFRRGVLRVA